MYPEDLKYTSEHEWVRNPGEGEGTVRVGITHFAQDALGDIVYVSLPDVGATVEAGTPVGELESTKSVSDVYAPVQRRSGLDARAGQLRPVRRRVALRGDRDRRFGGRRSDGRRGVPAAALTPESARRATPM